ncbi:hypothetical protein [Streptococcus plurextorum]|uniref:hypothetical protein n=1 Tax=Streptococcus plurextorum TaxID=456876 RepID=UPI00040F1C7D|nr:hypothetical protein [Streptococcus plurextorum]
MKKLYNRLQLLKLISTYCLGVVGISLVVAFIQQKWGIVIAAAIMVMAMSYVNAMLEQSMKELKDSQSLETRKENDND